MNIGVCVCALLGAQFCVLELDSVVILGCVRVFPWWCMNGTRGLNDQYFGSVHMWREIRVESLCGHRCMCVCVLLVSALSCVAELDCVVILGCCRVFLWWCMSGT